MLRDRRYDVSVPYSVLAASFTATAMDDPDNSHPFISLDVSLSCSLPFVEQSNCLITPTAGNPVTRGVYIVFRYGLLS